jgi:hypothetical protein
MESSKQQNEEISKLSTLEKPLPIAAATAASPTYSDDPGSPSPRLRKRPAAKSLLSRVGISHQFRAKQLIEIIAQRKEERVYYNERQINAEGKVVSRKNSEAKVDKSVEQQAFSDTEDKKAKKSDDKKKKNDKKAATAKTKKSSEKTNKVQNSKEKKRKIPAATPSTHENSAKSTAKKSRGGQPSEPFWVGKPDEKLEGGWPGGWIKKVYVRMSGKTKGGKDRYWYTPKESYKLRSMVEGEYIMFVNSFRHNLWPTNIFHHFLVRKFLKALEETDGDEATAKKIMRSISLK